MKPEEKENFRTSLLGVLEERASNKFGLSIHAIRIFLAQYGFHDSAAEDMAAELQYLADKGFVTLVSKTISPENRCWRITANGRDFLAA